MKHGQLFCISTHKVTEKVMSLERNKGNNTLNTTMASYRFYIHYFFALVFFGNGFSIVKTEIVFPKNLNVCLLVLSAIYGAFSRLIAL